MCPDGGGDKDASCGYWKDMKFCEPSQGFAVFMEKTCPASCGLCKGCLIFPLFALGITFYAEYIFSITAPRDKNNLRYCEGGTSLVFLLHNEENNFHIF